ncbi:hypothetical protein I4F81_012093 [Pyropia yezoensis]|uniref:Uncharacterized protein n=1 Tax=Pyropia yezoensis TaxID=2788 RepID=A0ACC3CHP0_PYRYE|nr:hypothetical protein I4F81_012093 [Neopyropia yezoensis]
MASTARRPRGRSLRSAMAVAAGLAVTAGAAAAVAGVGGHPLSSGGARDGGGGVAAAAAVTAAAAGAPANVLPATAARTFAVSDLSTTFNRFKRSDDCPPTIAHDSVRNPSSQVAVIAHQSIRADGTRCTSASSMIVLSSDGEPSADLDALLRDNALFRGVYEDLQARGAAFLIGYDSSRRVCGPWVFGDNSIVLFVDEPADVNVPGFANLKPRDGGYMLVFQDGTAEPCAYTSARSQTPIDGGTTAPVAEDAVPDSKPSPTPAVAVETPAPTPSPAATPTEEAPVVVPVPIVVPSTGEEATPTPTPEVVALASPTPTATPVADVAEAAADPTPTPTPTAAAADVPSAVVPDVATGDDNEGGRLGDVDDSACFPADATVALAGGGVKRMADLAVGDAVRVSPTATGRVYFFSHAAPGGSYPFVTLTTASGAAITLSPGHYLRVRVGGGGSGGTPPVLAAAATVSVGDALTLASGALSTVVAVEAVTRAGLYNPHATGGSGSSSGSGGDGGLLIDGVWASEYTTAVAPVLAAPALRVVRAAAAVAAQLGWGGRVTLPSGGGWWATLAPRGRDVVEL